VQDHIFYFGGETHLSDNDLRTLGLATVDPTPWHSLVTEDREILRRFLESKGTKSMSPQTVLETVDRLRRQGADPTKDAVLLRATYATTSRIDAEYNLGEVWTHLFTTTHRWKEIEWNKADSNGKSVLTVWRSRIRVPCKDGIWRPVVDTSLASDLPDAMQVDIAQVANLINIAPAEAARFLQQCGVWQGVPLYLRFHLPLNEEVSQAQQEWEEFCCEVPEEIWNVAGPDTPLHRAIYGFARGQRQVVDALSVDHPKAQCKNVYGRFPCGGYIGWDGRSILRPLAHAQLLPDMTDDLARRLVRERRWVEFSDLPIYHVRNVYDRISGRGHFPT
jgi:hypothetical protein